MKNSLPLRVAICGSSGHIGKNLISYFSKEKNCELYLFSRDRSLSINKLNNYFPQISPCIKTYDSFNDVKYDVIINCIGISNPHELVSDPSSVLTITELYDNKIINYLKKFPSTLYINLSSGAVFGEDFDSPVNDMTLSKFSINNPKSGYFYSISKLYSEAKHRLLSDRNIVDLRIFGFYSRFIDLKSKFFLCDLIRSIKNNTEFITNQVDIMRDYVHPSDFYSLICKCINKKTINDAFDVYSALPVSKFEILEKLSKKYDLKYIVNNKLDFSSPTGLKKNYYSTSRKARDMGYNPQYSSIDAILKETEFLLN